MSCYQIHFKWLSKQLQEYRLLKLKLFPLMYLFELQDILFAIKSLKAPTKQFSVTNYISFSSVCTRSGDSNKLSHLQHLNNMSRHSYFHQLLNLWNRLPTDQLLIVQVIKFKLKVYFWNQFIEHFADKNIVLSITYARVPPATIWRHLLLTWIICNLVF